MRPWLATCLSAVLSIVVTEKPSSSLHSWTPYHRRRSMMILGGLLMTVGGIAAFVGSIWLLVLAFQESIGWGLASLFIPFVLLIFAIMFWNKSAKPFGVWLGGAIILVLGAVLFTMGGANLLSNMPM